MFKAKSLDVRYVLGNDVYVGGVPTKKTMRSIDAAIKDYSQGQWELAYMIQNGDYTSGVTPIDEWNTVREILTAAPSVFIDAVNSGWIFPQMIYEPHLVIDCVIADTRERAKNIIDDLLDSVVLTEENADIDTYEIEYFLKCVRIDAREDTRNFMGCEDDRFIDAVLKNVAEFIRLEYLYRLSNELDIPFDMDVDYRMIKIIEQISLSALEAPNAAKAADKLLNKINKVCTIVRLAGSVKSQLFYASQIDDERVVLEPHKITSKLRTGCFDVITLYENELDSRRRARGNE